MKKPLCFRKNAGFGPAWRENPRSAGCAAALARLDGGQLFYAARMAPALKSGGKKSVYQLRGKALSLIHISEPTRP